jgi:outer membrane receptor protein involved in Fe transport
VGRSDDFRNRDIYTLDLRLEKEFAATGSMGLTFGIDAFNIFNENYVLGRDLQLNGARPDYLNRTLSPRIYRLSVRLSWR